MTKLQLHLVSYRRLMLLKLVKLVRADNSSPINIPGDALKHALFHLCDSYNSNDKWDSKSKLVAR